MAAKGLWDTKQGWRFHLETPYQGPTWHHDPGVLRSDSITGNGPAVALSTMSDDQGKALPPFVVLSLAICRNIDEDAAEFRLSCFLKQDSAASWDGSKGLPSPGRPNPKCHLSLISIRKEL
ncbi:hypothetical protein BH18ACI4_BH18ACI4_05310 [soil metagenome]